MQDLKADQPVSTLLLLLSLLLSLSLSLPLWLQCACRCTPLQPLCVTIVTWRAATPTCLWALTWSRWSSSGHR